MRASWRTCLYSSLLLPPFSQNHSIIYLLFTPHFEVHFIVHHHPTHKHHAFPRSLRRLVRYSGPRRAFSCSGGPERQRHFGRSSSHRSQLRLLGQMQQEMWLRWLPHSWVQRRSFAWMVSGSTQHARMCFEDMLELSEIPFHSYLGCKTTCGCW
jgi:hypothetical protein